MRRCSKGLPVGDIADWHIERMLDDGHLGFHSRRSTPPTCRTCGVLCYWGRRGGEWVLMEHGRPHACSEADKFNKAVSGFESTE